MVIEFCYIDTDYLSALKLIEPKIMHTDSFYSQESKRKFAIGILFELNDHKYYAPVSSIKQHQLSVVDASKIHPDFKKFCYPIKLKENRIENIVALIRLDFMFPVPEQSKKLVPFNSLELKYQKFIMKQYKYCKSNIDSIRAMAIDIYYRRIDDAATNFIKERCCNFKLLEEKHLEFISNN